MSGKVSKFAAVFEARKRINEESDTLVPDHSSTLVPDLPKIEPSQSITDLPEYSSTRVPEYQTAQVPESRYYKKPNEAADALDRHLSGAESKVFEHLWRLTIGFGRDRVQIRVSTLCGRTGYKSMKTVRVALFGLESKGLIMKVSRRNDPLGDEYVMLDSSTRVPKYQSTQAKGTRVLESKNTQDLNTVIKEQEPDDEAAPVRTFFFERFEALSKALTGKGIQKAEISKWAELLEVLETEARIAAGRTTVSSVPAFLAEHLRRRLWKKEKRQLDAESTSSEVARASVDISKCPDCFGTSMFYPEGFDKGVARCPHSKLVSKSEPEV